LGGIPVHAGCIGASTTQPGGSVEKDKRRETGPLLAIGRIAVLRFMSKTGWEMSPAGI